MSIINSQPLIGASGQGGYFLTKSLRFRASASAYLSRTPASAGNRKTFTWSGWVKKARVGTYNFGLIFCDTGSNSNKNEFSFLDTDKLFFEYISSGSSQSLTTTQVFRDPSAWYHIVLAVDTTQATSSNRVKIYVNGSQITAFDSANYPSQNADMWINSTNAHDIGRGNRNAGALYFDGYMTEINFIDGQALTPSSFGETSTSTGVWIPKKYTGTYGTNGFYLPFTDVATTSGSNAGLGKDFSGNGNYWTTNNISVTTGTTYDSMSDVPTLTSATAANYCTLNPLRNTLAAYGTISDGNLKVNGTQGAINCIAAGTMTFSGKMYCEMTIEVRGNDTTGAGVGIVPTTNNQFQTAINMSTGIYYLVSGQKEVTGTNSAYGSSYTTGDVIGIAVDVPAETVTFYKNNVSQGSISGTGIISAGVVPYIGFQDSGSPSIICNFGQQPFVYTPPSGFVAMNTFNLPTPTIGATASSQAGKYFNPVLYTGNGSSLSVTGVGFQPDFTWIKERDAIEDHFIFDAVRGATKYIRSNTTDAEGTLANYLTSFDSNGFSLGNGGGVNGTSDLYVAWNWKANGSGSTNTAGSITSTVSANTTAGFSIVTYTGNGSAGATIGHGLGAIPDFLFIKCRSNNTTNWFVGGTNVASAGNGTWSSVFEGLNTTNAVNTGATAVFNSTTPTSTVITLGNEINANGSGRTFVIYAWKAVAGYSAFGKYTGNGSSDGPFVFTGFRPRYVLIKRTDSGSAENWRIIDTVRRTYNVQGSEELYANSSSAEGSGTDFIDIISNGFKIRNSLSGSNANGGTYIYACFAESPFKYSLAR